MEKGPRSTPNQRTDFKTYISLQTRWQDVDVYGHVNNVVYFSYFDTAVNSWYLENKIIDPKSSSGVFLVVRNVCDFFSEINFPQTVHAGIKVSRLGNTSVTYEIALFIDEAEIACAKGEYVHIYVDRTTRRPMSIPNTIAMKLKSL